MELKGVHGTWGKTVGEVFKEVEFPPEWHQELMDYCNEIGIDFSTAPYSFEAVDLCASLDLPYIKIGSGEITWLEMIKYIASKTNQFSWQQEMPPCLKLMKLSELSNQRGIIILC